ncbi:MAG TPA: hypothetical protein VFG76_00540 [Candidatus Polarisedimenticolia bacterium]|nr:hypothetical protein [Candidatus Polarisedimenticolia bacterium]
MELKQRIDSCLTDLERKRRSVDTFQAKLRLLIDGLKSQGASPGALEELLRTLESILKDYSEMGDGCQLMIDGLREISDYMTRIEDGRQKILTGVEAILKNLSHLDRLAQGGLQVGTGKAGSPKRILLVRINPGTDQPSLKQEEDEEETPSPETVVH